MAISEIINSRLFRSTDQTVVLRDGQIIQGKILKIFPNNKAEIQLGRYKMIAEITTPLSVGQNYLFQVHQAKDQLTQLRVIGDVFKQDTSQTIVNLMEKLHLKVNKMNIQFVQMLINEKVPFDRFQIMQALQHLEKFGHSREIISILKEMIHHKLPVTNHTLQALFTYRNESLSPLLNNVLMDLTKTSRLSDVQLKLKSLLESITSNSESKQFIPNLRDRSYLNGLKLLGLTNKSMKVNEFSNSQSITNKGQTSIANILSLNVSEKDLFKLVNEAKSLQLTSLRLLRSFFPIQSVTLSDEQYALFSNSVLDQLIPKLPENQQKVVRSMLQNNTRINQRNLFHILQSLSNKEIYQLFERLLAIEVEDISTENRTLQSQFLAHLHRFISSVGISYESLLKTNLLTLSNEHINEMHNNYSNTIKSILLQMIRDESGKSNESIKQLLHFINGMQLQSVKESNHFIQVSFQLPGGKLFLPNDIYMQFEGKRTENGQIDADFCRIIFVLSLKNLHETIVDMQIQKRIVSITIYNEYSDLLAHRLNHYKETLAENLAQIHYQLSNIKWKPLNDQKDCNQMSDRISHGMDIELERFDFLI